MKIGYYEYVIPSYLAMSALELIQHMESYDEKIISPISDSSSRVSIRFMSEQEYKTAKVNYTLSTSNNK